MVSYTAAPGACLLAASNTPDSTERLHTSAADVETCGIVCMLGHTPQRNICCDSWYVSDWLLCRDQCEGVAKAVNSHFCENNVDVEVAYYHAGA